MAQIWAPMSTPTRSWSINLSYLLQPQFSQQILINSKTAGTIATRMKRGFQMYIKLQEKQTFSPWKLRNSNFDKMAAPGMLSWCHYCPGFFSARKVVKIASNQGSPTWTDRVWKEFHFDLIFVQNKGILSDISDIFRGHMTHPERGSPNEVCQYWCSLNWRLHPWLRMTHMTPSQTASKVIPESCTFHTLQESVTKVEISQETKK